MKMIHPVSQPVSRAKPGGKSVRVDSNFIFWFDPVPHGLRICNECPLSRSDPRERVIGRVIVEAGKIARKVKKKTIMPEHVAEAFAKHVGKEDLGWEEILAQVLRESPADLGKISKGIRDHMEQNKK